MTAGAPRMTAANAFGREHASRDRPMFADRFQRIRRTRRRVPATRIRPEQEHLRGREHQPVGPDGQDQYVLEQVHR